LDQFSGSGQTDQARVRQALEVGGGSTASHEQVEAIRDWARRNGHEASNRDRIPAADRGLPNSPGRVDSKDAEATTKAAVDS
jgi:hypothetical protein